MTTLPSESTPASDTRDRLFDHEYDGIREFDNPMPAWWVWMFVGSVIFSVVYVGWYHLGAGSSIHERYEGELAAYADMLLEQYGELEPDAPTIYRFMDDPVAMAGMGSLFRNKCAQCHLADASGSVGPNLTDRAWKNVKTITDIPAFISTGNVPKGMPQWEGTITPTQIVLMSAYVAQLQRRPLPGKPAEGTVLPLWDAGRPAEASEGAGAGEGAAAPPEPGS